MEEEQEKLEIPTNVPESRATDFFDGFGPKELIILSSSLVTAIILAVILYLYTKQILFSIIICAGIMGSTFLVTKRDIYDESFIDQLKIIWKFHKAQKVYEYEYFNIYEENEEQG